MRALPKGLKTLLRRGFTVLPRNEAEELLNVLRSCGAIHLVHVNRLGRYVVIEINKLACIKECDVKCRDPVSGRKLLECESECIDKCVIERLNTLASKILSQDLKEV